MTVADEANVVCTFSNQQESDPAPAGDLTIILEAEPEDDTNFNFTGNSGLGAFSLSDPSNNTQTFSGITPGTYTITETVPAGWTLDDASCTGGNSSSVANGVSVTIADGDDVTCTFSNQHSLVELSWRTYLPLVLR